MHSRKRYIWGYSLALVSALSFSTKGVIAKLLYAHGMEPVGMLALRFAIATPFFWALLFLFPSEKVRPRDIGYLVLSGILGIYLSALADFARATSSSASMDPMVSPISSTGRWSSSAAPKSAAGRSQPGRWSGCAKTAPAS